MKNNFFIISFMLYRDQVQSNTTKIFDVSLWEKTDKKKKRAKSRQEIIHRSFIHWTEDCKIDKVARKYISTTEFLFLFSFFFFLDIIIGVAEYISTAGRWRLKGYSKCAEVWRTVGQLWTNLLYWLNNLQINIYIYIYIYIWSSSFQKNK